MTFVSAFCYYVSMRTYDTVETYLEVMSGLRDVVTGKLVSNYYLGFAPIINLARYDRDVLDSMSQATLANRPLTTKQGDLLCKILLKYQRQLAAKSIDVSPIENPTWRLPLRVMNYQKIIDLQDDQIILRFPYNNNLVDDLRQFAKESQGKCHWDNDAKVWRAALTEYNLVWLQTWGNKNGFEVSEGAAALISLVEAAEAREYAIELTINDQGLDITNCPESLREYINEHHGGFGFDNLYKLADLSGELGYRIEANLANALVSRYGPRFITLCENHTLTLGDVTKFTDDDFRSVLDHAIQAGRVPVVIYEPDLSNNLLNKMRQWYPESDIFQCHNGLITDLPDAKFVHTVKPIRTTARIPLLVSKAGIMIGAGQQLMTQHAGKIVFAVADVYNSKQKVVKIAS